MLAIQWALIEASLLSLSCLAHTLLLAACRCPCPSLDALPRMQEETALAATRLSSLLSIDTDWHTQFSSDRYKGSFRYHLILFWQLLEPLPINQSIILGNPL